MIIINACTAFSDLLYVNCLTMNFTHNAPQRTNDRQCELQHDTNGAKFTRRFYASEFVAIYLTELMKR